MFDLFREDILKTRVGISRYTSDDSESITVRAQQELRQIIASTALKHEIFWYMVTFIPKDGNIEQYVTVDLGKGKDYWTEVYIFRRESIEESKENLDGYIVTFSVHPHK